MASTLPGMEVSLRQLARQQHLVISRAQAYGHGESERRVQTRLRRGEWVQLLPDAFLTSVGPPSVDSRLEAVRLAVPDPYVLSGCGAVLVHGALTPDLVKVVNVSVPRSRASWTAEGLVLRRAVLPDVQLLRRRLQVPVLPVAVREAAADLSGPQLDGVVESALRERTSTGARLLAECRRGWAGSAALRAALARVDDGHWSFPERTLGRGLRAALAPEFETNAPVGAYPGLVRYVDLLWRGLRKGVAVNGWIWHSRRDQFQRDHDTAAWLRLDHGIEILPVTARDCIHATPGTVARVLRFLGC